MKTRLLAGLLIAASIAVAADREFDRIANVIESHYGVKRMHIPLMGLANLFVKVAHPAGTKSVKVAIFEDLGARASYDPLDVDQLYDELTRKGLRPLVRVQSQRNNESTFICTGEMGKSSTTLVVATFERNAATVVEVRMNMETLIETLFSPEGAGKMFGVRHDSW